MLIRNSFSLLNFLFFVLFCSQIAASEDLQSGAKYKNTKPLYIMGVYNSLNNRIISRSTARAYLHTKRYFEKTEVAFQEKVPVGTVMTIIHPAPKVWYLPFLADRYFVQLEPDLSHGLEIVLELNRGMEGSLDGLNSRLFVRVDR